MVVYRSHPLTKNVDQQEVFQRCLPLQGHSAASTCGCGESANQQYFIYLFGDIWGDPFLSTYWNSGEGVKLAIGWWKGVVDGMIWRWRHGRWLLFFFGYGIHTVSPHWQEDEKKFLRIVQDQLVGCQAKCWRTWRFWPPDYPESQLKVKHHPGTRLLAEGYREVYLALDR